MKIHILLAIALSLTILVIGCNKDQDPIAPPASQGITTQDVASADDGDTQWMDLRSGTSPTGNGALSGPHYNLNLIGVSKEKEPDMTGDNGHRIFVNLEGNTRINLREGEEFMVLDANGTDGNGAAFQLPNPDPDNDGITEYSVYARALGKPGGSSITTTCASDTNDITYCSMLQMVLVRDSGPSKFTNVSKYLLYIYADINGDGTTERVPLFDSRLQDYYWSYDNNHLKLAQLRFYQVSSTVP